MKKCKHRWHLLKEFYIDGWSSINSSRRYPIGWYVKFVCESCGDTKVVQEKDKWQKSH